MAAQGNKFRVKKRYRVVQSATGNVGSRALQRAIQHPDLDVAGAYVYSANKIGRDVGDLVWLIPNWHYRYQQHRRCNRT